MAVSPVVTHSLGLPPAVRHAGGTNERTLHHRPRSSIIQEKFVSAPVRAAAYSGTAATD